MEKPPVNHPPAAN